MLGYGVTASQLLLRALVFLSAGASYVLSKDDLEKGYHALPKVRRELTRCLRELCEMVMAAVLATSAATHTLRMNTQRRRISPKATLLSCPTLPFYLYRSNKTCCRGLLPASGSLQRSRGRASLT